MTGETRYCESCGTAIPYLSRRAYHYRTRRFCGNACVEASRAENPWIRRPAADRFWEKVSISLAPDGCWEWLGTRCQDGYGFFSIPTRMIGAHRWAYERAYGPIAPGKVVRHQCHNPRCVRPDHLLTGTPLDNARDSVGSGRTVLKRYHGKMRLGQSQIEEMRRLSLHGNQSQIQLAALFGISQGHASRSLRGRDGK